MEEPGGLQSMRSPRVGHDWATSLSFFTSMHWRRKWQPTPVFLPGESQGQGSLVGCCLWVTQSRTQLKWLSSSSRDIHNKMFYFHNRRILECSTRFHNVFRLTTTQVALVVKSPSASAGDVRDMGSIPGLGRFPGGGHSNPLHYSCLENPVDRGAWQATVQRVSQSRMQLKRLSTHA